MSSEAVASQSPPVAYTLGNLLWVQVNIPRAIRLIVFATIITAVQAAIEHVLVQSNFKDSLPYRESKWMKFVIAACEIAIGILVAGSFYVAFNANR